MKKIDKLNNKGFVLVETLIVAVAVAAIFSLVFKHFFPLMGEYERREDYDDIDSKYGTYWIKRLIQSDMYNFAKGPNADGKNIYNNGYSVFSCQNLIDPLKQKMCNQILIDLEVSCDDNTTNDKIEKCDGIRNPHIYITPYQLRGAPKDVVDDSKVESGNVKDVFINDNTQMFSDGLKEYLLYLPDYSKVQSLNGAKYRIIIEYYRHRFDNEDATGDATSYEIDDFDFSTYSTIEVIKYYDGSH